MPRPMSSKVPGARNTRKPKLIPFITGQLVHITAGPYTGQTAHVVRAGKGKTTVRFSIGIKPKTAKSQSAQPKNKEASHMVQRRKENTVSKRQRIMGIDNTDLRSHKTEEKKTVRRRQRVDLASKKLGQLQQANADRNESWENRGGYKIFRWERIKRHDEAEGKILKLRKQLKGVGATEGLISREGLPRKRPSKTNRARIRRQTREEANELVDYVDEPIKPRRRKRKLKYNPYAPDKKGTRIGDLVKK